MGKLTIQDAEILAQRGRPWTLRLEYVGTNAANASGTSSKYWYATGRGLQEAVETGHGAIGAAPIYHLINWTELSLKVQEKLGKNYQYVNTPFIRMSAESLARVTGTVTPTTSSAKAVSSLTSSKVVVTNSMTSSIPAPPSIPAQILLGPPYNLIRVLKIIRQGLSITGYSALDVDGVELLVLSPTGALDFAREYGVDILFS